jgi:hypothetical protein
MIRPKDGSNVDDSKSQLVMSSICNVITYRDPPNDGLAVARQIAMISYRTPHGYESKFSRRKDAASGAWEVKNYLQYQVRRVSSITHFFIWYDKPAVLVCVCVCVCRELSLSRGSTR